MPKIEKIKKRHMLKKREQKLELERLEKALSSPIKGFDSKSRFESGILDDGTKVLMFEGDILFFESNGEIYPTLYALLNETVVIPKVTVDMGAIRFVINGADIMRPGVTSVEDGISNGSIVAVVDERHGKPLAVGTSLMSSDELRAATKGKVIKSVHYINDHLWDFSKS